MEPSVETKKVGEKNWLLKTKKKMVKKNAILLILTNVAWTDVTLWVVTF